uniref:Rab3 GTPase-activating protein catalytic subunit n=1 Tax=Parascaris equorum TaxID=6256 RepID=A0A914S4M1_PAREQ
MLCNYFADSIWTIFVDDTRNMSFWFSYFRAEQSQKDAKIVVDASRLSRLRNSNFRGTFDENEGMFTVENDSILVQMDSLPEIYFHSDKPDNDAAVLFLNQSALEVTAAPAPPPSIASSYTDRPQSSLSTKSSNTVSPARQSLKSDFTLCLSVSRNNIPLVIFPGSLIDDYAARLARHICLMAIADNQPTHFTDVWQAFEEAVIEEGDLNESAPRFGSPFHQVSISFDCIQSLARMLQETDQQSRPHSATGVTVEESHGGGAEQYSSGNLHYALLDEEDSSASNDQEIWQKQQVQESAVQRVPSSSVQHGRENAEVLTGRKMEELVKQLVDQLWRQIIVKVFSEIEEICLQSAQSNAVAYTDVNSDDRTDSDESEIENYTILREEDDDDIDTEDHLNEQLYTEIAEAGSFIPLRFKSGSGEVDEDVSEERGRSEHPTYTSLQDDRSSSDDKYKSSNLYYKTKTAQEKTILTANTAPSEIDLIDGYKDDIKGTDTAAESYHLTTVAQRGRNEENLIADMKPQVEERPFSSIQEGKKHSVGEGDSPSATHIERNVVDRERGSEEIDLPN